MSCLKPVQGVVQGAGGVHDGGPADLPGQGGICVFLDTQYLYMSLTFVS